MSASLVSEILGIDPRRPWPGVARDVAAAETGLAELAAGGTVLSLVGESDAWPDVDQSFDVVVAPLGLLTAASHPAGHIRRFGELVRPGGLLVTEELAPPGDLTFVEPTVVDHFTVVLSAVSAAAGLYRLASVRFTNQSRSVRTCELRPRRPADIDEVLAGRFALVGRWADWMGGLAEGAPWHVAVHQSCCAVSDTAQHVGDAG